MAYRKSVITLILLLGSSWQAQAEVFTVTTADDLVDANVGDGVCLTASNNCSLRAAIQESNAWPGRDTIELPVGLYKLTIDDPPSPAQPGRGTVEDNTAANGDLDIRDHLSINGAGSDHVAIDGSAKTRVFDITQNVDVTIHGVTIRNGADNSNDGAGGGGINIGNATVNQAVVTINDSNIEWNSATYGGGINVAFGNKLTLNRSVISSNTALSHAGGLNNDSGTIVINYSSISDNRATGFGNPLGGGIFNSSANGGGMTIRDSLISGNQAAFYGGGIYHVVGKLWIYNTTISNNHTWGWGGGIYHTGGTLATTTLQHVTMTGNRSGGTINQQNEPRGGAIYNANGARMMLSNSIIANNGATGENCYIEHGDDSQIKKLGNVISDDSCLNADEAAYPIAQALGLNSLSNYGGPTNTHSIRSNSDAINAGHANFCLSTDQRGFTRDSNCDSGAYEFAAAPPRVELLPTLPYGGANPARGDTAPTAFDMLITVKPGDVVRNVATGVDDDTHVLTYHIVDQARQGTAAFEATQFVGGDFYYRADADASGSDTFTFEACDRFDCSEPATVTILFEEAAVSGSMSIELTTEGHVSPLQVFPEAEVEAITTPDLEFSAPFGTFFFNVSEIPANATSTTVIIQLPIDAIIDDNAVVRKLTKFNEWLTLHSGDDPSRSTASINRDNNTITLTLRDNDIFDLNPATGIISDPVALGVPKAAPAAVTEPEETTIVTPAEETSSAVPVDENSGGGGMLGLGWSLLLAISAATFRRNRFNITKH